ncbi:hypothetical protein JTE90_023221 [Oedothorax gibbosus]|uniref:Uncharacterized protein n=1 Tax=Oedothorax gibbosus TaxID=931172 RepID=A0AAV6VLE0_9ARAC|nr:hypothetical protein JTE90_023221 [Oedothorax gibbosus]
MADLFHLRPLPSSSCSSSSFGTFYDRFRRKETGTVLSYTMTTRLDVYACGYDRLLHCLCAREYVRRPYPPPSDV